MARRLGVELFPQEEANRHAEEVEPRHDNTHRFHNKVHKVVVKSTGQTLYGLVSKVDYDRREFYLLETDTPGMIGKDGRKFSWDDCIVMAEGEKGKVGLFSDDMVREWDNYIRKMGVGVR